MPNLPVFSHLITKGHDIETHALPDLCLQALKVAETPPCGRKGINY